MSQIPKGFKKYFWEVDISKINLKKNQTYVIERIVDHGDLEAFKWLRKNYPQQLIKSVALKSRRVSPRTKNFFQLIY